MTSPALNTASDSPPVSEQAICGHCGNSFERRKGNGGKPQKFCSPTCKSAARSQRTAGDANGQTEPPALTAHNFRKLAIAGAEDYAAKYPDDTNGESGPELVDRMVAEGKVRLPVNGEQIFSDEGAQLGQPDRLVIQRQLQIDVLPMAGGGAELRQEGVHGDAETDGGIIHVAAHACVQLARVLFTATGWRKVHFIVDTGYDDEEIFDGMTPDAFEYRSSTPVPPPPVAAPKIEEPATEPEDNEFRWTDEDTVIEDQHAVAVYRNPRNNLVIRQSSPDGRSDDPFIVIQARNIQTFVDAVISEAKGGYA